MIKKKARNKTIMSTTTITATAKRQKIKENNYDKLAGRVTYPHNNSQLGLLRQ